MAGTYPLGYDLFTFVFQTAFLLGPQKSTTKLIEENKALIKHYFKALGIKNWQTYLSAFSTIKIELESCKGNQSLLSPYKTFKKDVEKI